MYSLGSLGTWDLSVSQPMDFKVWLRELSKLGKPEVIKNWTSLPTPLSLKNSVFVFLNKQTRRVNDNRSSHKTRTTSSSNPVGTSSNSSDLPTMNNAFMARLLPRTHLASTQSTLTTDLAKTTTKYSYASAGLKAATAQWERINASADLCADLHVKKAKFLAEQAGWQCDLMEVEEKLWDIKEQEINSDDRELEATQLRVKKGLLKGLLKKIVEALRGVEMLVGPAVSSSFCFRVH